MINNTPPTSLTLIHNRNREWDESKVTRDASGQFARSRAGQRIADRKIERAGTKAALSKMDEGFDSINEVVAVRDAAKSVKRQELKAKTQRIHDIPDRIKNVGKRLISRLNTQPSMQIRSISSQDYRVRSDGSRQAMPSSTPPRETNRQRLDRLNSASPSPQSTSSGGNLTRSQQRSLDRTTRSRQKTLDRLEREEQRRR